MLFSRKEYEQRLQKTKERMREITEIVVEGLEKTLDFIEPGVTCKAIEEKWRKSIAKGELVGALRLGYSFGLN
ncbi:MAG: M24 family metallopeptidase [Bacillota bacterium]